MMETGSAVAVRISKAYRGLSAAERRIADFTVANQDVYAHATAEEIARRTETSAATVIRFARSLGFRGLTDMKVFMLENAAPGGEHAEIELPEEPDSLIRETLEYNRGCVNDLAADIEETQVLAAVDALAGAKTIYILASGTSGGAALCACDAFLKLGLRCVLLTDAIFQVMTLSACDDPEHSVVLGICHSGRSRDVLDAMQVAREKGIRTIGIIGSEDVPLARWLDIPLVLHSRESASFSDTMAARICELYVISFLCAGIARDMGEEAVDGIRREVYGGISKKRVKGHGPDSAS